MQALARKVHKTKGNLQIKTQTITSTKEELK